MRLVHNSVDARRWRAVGRQGTVGATSSHERGLTCVAALTRAACRINGASGTKARGWSAVGPWRYASCHIR
jgi:hypothetical protein